MIFISYTHKDKELVDVITQHLSSVFNQDKIFYDAWSIQPGDGIVEKMEEGLKKCKFFFFFVSKNSLLSNMVKLEWQNAIIKATKNEAKLIPVKLDDCMMPQVLLQTLYIDIFGQGLENGIRQMIDVVQDINRYNPPSQTYENLRGYIKKAEKEITIEFKAETYLEPISRFLILLENNENEIETDCVSDSFFNHGFNKDLKLNTGLNTNGIFVAVQRGTSPGFPFVVKIKQKIDTSIKFNGLMRAINQNEYKMIPLIEVK